VVCAVLFLSGRLFISATRAASEVATGQADAANAGGRRHAIPAAVTMSGMEHIRIRGHSPYEQVFGFSRAVVAGQRVLVAGTAPVAPGGAPPPADPYAQARLCLTLIEEALEKAGTSLEHVIRTRIFLTDVRNWEEIARAHGDVFAAIRPAATAVIVAGLLDPAWLVEIEAEATLPAES
jgi:enamine deaminase RidA (YjgF/YER057c/UK114 family)